MNDERRELAALAALGLLSADDAARLSEAASAHPALAQEFESDRATVERLGLVADRAITTPDLADRLVAATTAAPRGDTARARPRPAWPGVRWRRWVPALGSAVAAAAAAVAITLVATRDPGLGTPEVRATVVSHAGQAPVTGTAALYRPGHSDGRVVLDLASFPAAPPGHHYAVWVLRTGATAMEAVGTFATDRTQSVHLELRLPGSGRYGALDISVEEDAGPPEHSGTSVAGATFGA